MFTDRHHGGQLLSEKLSSYKGQNAVVVGLARGGVVVSAIVAKTCSLLLDVLIVKKIPSPIDPELAIGALAPDGVSYVDWKIAHQFGGDEGYVQSQIRTLSDQIRQKILLYRKGMKSLELKDKTVILVDDGAATGATMEAAIAWAKKKHAKRIVVALPVAPKALTEQLKPEVAELIVLHTPEDFSSVGQFYENSPQVEDGEVIKLLRDSRTGR